MDDALENSELPRGGGRIQRLRTALVAIPLFASLALALPSAAFAGRDIHVTVANRTPVSLKLVETNNHCWYAGDFRPGQAPRIAPGATRQLNSEVKAPGKCHFLSSSMDWDVLFERAGGSFRTALGDADARDYARGGGTWGMNWPYATGLVSPRSTPRGWFPITPQQGVPAAPAGCSASTPRGPAASG